MFPMVPFANCIRDNRFTFDATDYSVSPNMTGSRLNFHGTGWMHPWTVEEHSTNHTILTLECCDDAYSFAATQAFHLSDKTLSVATSLTNKAPFRLPFGMGQHPWFPRQGGVKVRFQSGTYLSCDEEGLTTYRSKTLRAFDFSRWKEPLRAYQNRCYEDWTGLVEVYWPGAGVGLAISADKIFRHLMFHVPANDPETFCLEPQSNAPCGFDTLSKGEIGPGIHILETDETLCGNIEFLVSDAPEGSSYSL